MNEGEIVGWIGKKAPGFVSKCEMVDPDEGGSAQRMIGMLNSLNGAYE